jgi:PAS domain S-box-containing protein
MHFTLDPASLRFTSVEGTRDDLLGFSENDWLADGFWLLRIHPEDRAPVKTLLSTCDSETEPKDIEYRMLDRGGNIVWVLQHCDIRLRDGVHVAVGFIIDITARVASENDLKRTQEMREALLRLISREFSQPINAISGYGKMLERHLSIQGDDVGSDYALGVRDGIQQLSDAVLQLREVAEGEGSELDDLVRATRGEGIEFGSPRGGTDT